MIAFKFTTILTAFLGISWLSDFINIHGWMIMLPFTLYMSGLVLSGLLVSTGTAISAIPHMENSVIPSIFTCSGMLLAVLLTSDVYEIQWYFRNMFGSNREEGCSDMAPYKVEGTMNEEKSND